VTRHANLKAGELTSDQLNDIQRREGVALISARDELAALMVSVEVTQHTAPETTCALARRCRRSVSRSCSSTHSFLRRHRVRPGTPAMGALTSRVHNSSDRLLTQGEVDVANSQDATALNAYEKVLTLDPKNVTALTQSAGSISRPGVREEGFDRRSRHQGLGKGDCRGASTAGASAVLRHRRRFDAGNQRVAKAEFEEFLKLKPSVGQLAIARPFLKKLGLPSP